jgi:hypothetical protein
MGQTVASLSSVLKDAWTSERMAKQFYDENPLLEKFKAVQATMIGQQAQVPIHSGRSGGYTSVAAAGGSLNPAGNQVTDQAIYTLVNHWFQIAIEAAALNQSGSNVQSIIGAKDLELQGAIKDLAKQCSRQLAGNGDGLIAQCTTGGASTTVNLLPDASGGYGAQALTRGHLYVGMPVDIGTTADSDSLVAGSVITAIDDTPTAPTITIGSSITTTSSHYVSIANPNSATATNPEMNGLRNMISRTTTLGGINPATAGDEFWKAAKVDTSTTSFSIDMALDLQRAVFQQTGSYDGTVITSAKQQANFYSLLQNQVRFSGEVGMGAGGIGGLLGLKWNGMSINVLPDIYDPHWFHVNLKDLVRITGSWKEPMWVSDIEGSGGQLRWGQGTTGFVDAVTFPMQTGVQRRSTHAAATALTA